MASITVGFDPAGDERFANAIAKIGSRAVTILHQALGEAGTVLLGHVQALTPLKTGALKAGLNKRLIKGRGKWSGVIVRTPTREALGILPSDKHYYPASLEFGFSRRTKGGKIVHVPARSYLRRGLEDKKDQIQSVIKERFLKRLIREVTN